MINKINTNKELRQFGFIFFGYFIFLFFLISRIHHEHIHLNNKWFFLPSFVLVFLIFPKILFPIKLTWDFILKILNWVNTRILLGIIFFLIFTSIAFFKRILRKDTMELQFDHIAPTYRTTVTESNDIRKPY